MKYQIVTAYVGGQYAYTPYATDSQADAMEQLQALRDANGSPYRHYWIMEVSA